MNTMNYDLYEELREAMMTIGEDYDEDRLSEELKRILGYEESYTLARAIIAEMRIREAVIRRGISSTNRFWDYRKAREERMSANRIFKRG